MLKKLISFCLIITMVFLIIGCFTINHVVGNGAQGSQVTEQRQWFVLWGLVPINEVDSKAMADGAADYTITDEITFVDGVISIVTGIISVSPRTIRVTK